MVESSIGKYSKQREAIYETLRLMHTHPSAEELYARVRESLPEVGMATVYRNLKTLVRRGLVSTVETADDRVHYDGDVTPHAHFVCERCGRITDLYGSDGGAELLASAGYKVEREKRVYYGVCPECNG